MDAFEDDNPFETDDRISEETSSSLKIDISEPNTPPQSFSPLPDAHTSPPNPPTPSTKSFPGSHKPHQHTPQHPSAYKTDFCCSRDRWLHSGQDFEILISDAQKTSVNSSSPYITYIIKAGNAHAHHRYSEFESLRSSLVKLYPTLIIPPIPSKNTLGDYAIKQTKAKEDAALIARRKRMLQTFLNRVAKHPILSNEHVFHRFLDGEVSWTEVLHSPPLSLLPKNILKAPAHNPTSPTLSLAYAHLPTPSATHTLRTPDQRFLDSESFTNKFASHISGPMEKVTRRVLKRWNDDAQDHSELGAALNGFSLNESGSGRGGDGVGAPLLAGALERTGQAVDATYISTAKLLQELEQNWAEPLHEYAQFASIIKKILVYRHQKHVQYEMTQDTLEAKRARLEELEKSEREARRLEDALGRGRISGIGARAGGVRASTSASASAATSAPMSQSQTRAQRRHSSVHGGEVDRDGDRDQDEEAGEGEDEDSSDEPRDPRDLYLPPHPGPNPARRKSASSAPGMGLFNALSYTLHGMMDVDPEAARRNGITKTRENIVSLEEALHLSVQDLKYSNSTIQADLDRFQRQKVADMREMAISMARSHRDWCKKNLEAWEEAKKEIEKIPEHPNKVPSFSPSSESGEAGPSSTSKRDSSATLNGR